MANKKTVLKVKHNIETERPWEVLRPGTDAEYHKHGRKYSINQLYSLHTNARRDYFFIFDSAEDKRRYIWDLKAYKAQMVKKRELWEEEQAKRRKEHEAKVRAGDWHVQAHDMIAEIRDHENN